MELSRLLFGDYNYENQGIQMANWTKVLVAKWEKNSYYLNSSFWTERMALIHMGGDSFHQTGTKRHKAF
jgi:hypothetical protein